MGVWIHQQANDHAKIWSGQMTTQKYGQDPLCQSWLRKALLLSGKSKLAGYLQELVCWSWIEASWNNEQSIAQDSEHDASMRGMTPHWSNLNIFGDDRLRT